MSNEDFDQRSKQAFLGTYQRMIDALPGDELEWPPSYRTQWPEPRPHMNRIWVVVLAALLGLVGFGVGWFAAPEPGVGTTPAYQPAPPTTAPAAPVDDPTTYATAHEAVRAAALRQVPNLGSSTYRMVVIHAGEWLVDLRVALQAQGFCHWYGVQGRVVDGKLEWRAAPSGDDCDPQ